MASLEQFRRNEKEYAFLGFSLSEVKRGVKEDLKTFINSGIEDSKKKLSALYPQKDISQTIEKMRNIYLSTVDKYSSQLDAAVDESLKLDEFINDSENSGSDEENMNQEMDSLRMKLLALNKYRSELEKVEKELLDDDVLDFSEQSDLLMKMEASSSQWRSEMSLMADLFSKKAPSTTELENSVMNMSIG